MPLDAAADDATLPIGGDDLERAGARGGVRPGEVIAGKYRVERVLGVGGMGVVVAAEHLDLQERVALKLLLPEALESSEAIERFMREARAVAKIKGEHVARVADVGKLETGAPYIVMEYLEGTDLSALIARQGPLQATDAIEYVLQACEALAEAHALGIIHRDLKPSNLFLIQRPDGSPCIKVLDFGISKVLPREEPDAPTDFIRTRTAQILGTPLYMSPEQITSSKSVGMPSDIWSLGAVLFELLSGSPAIQASSLQGLRLQILHEPAPLLRRYKPDAPRRLEAVIARCLEKDPAKRYPDVAELALDLRGLARRRALISVERIRRILRNAGLGADRGEEVAVSQRDSSTLMTRTPRWVVGAIVATVAVAVAGAAALAVAAGRSEEPADSPPSVASQPSAPEPNAGPTIAPLADPREADSVSAAPTSSTPAPSPSGTSTHIPASPRTSPATTRRAEGTNPTSVPSAAKPSGTDPFPMTAHPSSEL